MTTTGTATDPGAVRPALEKVFHADCFACGISRGSGLSLHFEVGPDGVAKAVWMPSETFASYPDRVHGGIVATLIDSAMVHALFARGVAGVTAELTIRYNRSVSLRHPVEISGWVESERRGIYYCRAEVRQNGALAARAGAKFMRLVRPRG
jgi:acyl-coenzyme A thioesterase PaaI-like protein